jgi:signal transduction histidine kinase
MLDLSRLEGGQMPLNRGKVSPQVLLSEALEVVMPHAEQRQQTVQVELSPDLPPVNADREMIRRVLINLLENAVKYSPPGAHIRAGARREGQMVRFWVADNGPGIPKEEQERIFHKYDRGSAKRGKGLGLGLAFARLAVQAHGGTIGVESEPGQGALFCFTLPVADDETPAA